MDICLKRTDQVYCEGIDQLTSVSGYPILTATLSSEEICTRAGYCDDAIYLKDRIEDYTKHILDDSPRPPVREKIMVVSKKPIRFIIVADIHVDYEYTEGRSGAACGDLICCRKNSPIATDPNDASGKFGFIGLCDIPLITAESFTKVAGEMNPDFVVFLGDTPDHDVMHQEPSTHLRGLKDFSKLLRDNYNGTVYPLLGNHEGLPCDTFDLTKGGKHDWIIKEAIDAWGNWLTEEMKTTFLENGCYSVLHPDTNLRIISLNAFVQLADNVLLWGNQTDPLGTLKWLEAELAKSEKSNEDVLIISHMPSFNPPFNPYWSERYLVLVERYGNIIKGQMHGHVHQEYFALLKGRKNQTVGIGHVNPSLSTHVYSYPSFRVYDMNEFNHDLLDYTQYHLNMSRSNKELKPYWEEAYKFSDYYGVPDLSFRSHELLVEKMKNDNETWRRVLNARYQEGPIGKKVFSQPELWEAHLCDYTSSTIMQLVNCTGRNTEDQYGCYGYFFEQFPACRDWFYRIPKNNN